MQGIQNMSETEVNIPRHILFLRVFMCDEGGSQMFQKIYKQSEKYRYKSILGSQSQDL